MKKLLSVILTGAILCTSCLMFTSCSGSDSGTDNTGTQSTAQDSKKIASKEDLKGAKIGVQLGTTGDIYASDYEEEGSVIERYNKGADAVLALTQGKVDCVVIDSEPAKAFVAQNQGLKILDEPFENEDYAVAIAKDNDKLTTEFNKALKELKEDGTVQKIIDNFIGDDTKGKSPYKTPDGTDTSKGELHMATNAAFEPYEFKEGGEIVGIDPMIAQAVCDKMGYKLVIDDMDFDTIITAISTGKADFGMAGMTVTDERKEAVNFTDSYTTATQVIIVKE